MESFTPQHFLISSDPTSENINYRLKINKNMEAYLLCPKANVGLIYSGPFMNSTDETLKARQKHNRSWQELNQ